MKFNIKFNLSIIVVFVSIIIFTNYLLAQTSSPVFTEPSCAPPNCNASEPLNTSTFDQIKDGSLTILNAIFNGKVGIGTSNLNKPLTVKGSGASGSNGQVLITPDGLNGLFLAASSSNTHYNWLIGEQYNVDKSLEFTPSTAVGGKTFSKPAMTLHATGNVGIGDNSPSDKLSVAGHVSFNEDKASRIRFEDQGSFNRIAFNEIRFWDWDTGVDMVTFNNGNVGIGTSNPRANAKLTLSGTSPTIGFDDTDGKSGMIHVNGNLMYFLSACGETGLNQNGDWCQNNNKWPLYLNLTNNDAVFGGRILTYDSVAIGSNTLANSLWGHNIAIGTAALLNNNGGVMNVGIGFQSMLMNNSGKYNIALGTNSLMRNIAGNYNIAIGYNALPNRTISNNNIAIGNNALDQENLTGDNNIAIGNNSGISYGGYYTDTVAIGNNAKVGRSYSIVLGDPGNTNVSVGIGTNVPTGKLTVEGGDMYLIGKLYNNLGGNWIRMNRQVEGRYFEYVIDNVAYGVSMWYSSKRFKKDINDLEFDSRKIYNLRPVSFTHKNNNKRDFGLIAEEVEKVIPELVNYDNEGKPFSVRYELLSVLALNELKEKVSELESLQKTVGELTKRIESLEKVNNK